MEETVAAVGSNAVDLVVPSDATLSKTLSFLFQLAWDVRKKLPAAIMFLFLAFDIALTVDMDLTNIDVEDLSFDDDEDDEDGDDGAALVDDNWLELGQIYPTAS